MHSYPITPWVGFLGAVRGEGTVAPRGRAGVTTWAAVWVRYTGVFGARMEAACGVTKATLAVGGALKMFAR